MQPLRSQTSLSDLLLALLSAMCLVSASSLNAQADDAIAEKAAVCAACHGETGVPIDKVTPNIWGQREGYLYLQLKDFKSGSSIWINMNGIPP